MNNDTVPKENIRIYKLLYKVEVGLREYIIEILEGRFGAGWLKGRVPGDVLAVSRKGIEDERRIPWSQLVPHHPIYYVNFPDLQKIILRDDNWRDVFKNVFKRKEVLIGTLTELEPVRNKIAHNRRTTPGDLRIVEGAYQKIVEIIGPERLESLVMKCTLGESIVDALSNLRLNAESVFMLCKECAPIGGLDAWSNVRTRWWFDANYLGHEITPIQDFFETVFAYGQLPRQRGSGHRIEHWVKTSDLDNKYTKALACFKLLFEQFESL